MFGLARANRALASNFFILDFITQDLATGLFLERFAAFLLPAPSDANYAATFLHNPFYRVNIFGIVHSFSERFPSSISQIISYFL